MIKSGISTDAYLDLFNTIKKINKNSSVLQEEKIFSAFALFSIKVDDNKNSGGFMQVGSEIDIISMMVQAMMDEPRLEHNLKIAIDFYNKLKNSKKK